MKKLFKENLKYIVFVLSVWAVAVPVIFYNKDWLYSKYALFTAPRAYSPKAMKSFIEKGDSAKGDIDLDLMKEICSYYTSLSNLDSVFYDATWLDRTTRWTVDKEKSQKGIGNRRKILPPSIDPKSYWNEHLEAVAKALDYYKRALNVSGPEIAAAKLIEPAALATCRPAEILLAYASHIRNSENYVLEKISKETDSLNGLTEKQKLSIVWSQIKNGKIPELPANDFLYSMTRLVSNMRLAKSSPYEALSILEKLIYFSGGSEWDENQFRFKRGILFYETAKENKSYYNNAILEFKASAEFQNLKEESNTKVRLMITHRFQAILMIAKCYFQKKDYNQALSVIQSLEPQLRNIDGRDGGPANHELQDDYQNTRRRILRMLNRTEEADEGLE